MGKGWQRVAIDGVQGDRVECGGYEGGVTGVPCPLQMWTSAPRARASVAEGSVRTCPALSTVFARLASGAQHVKRMWMNVPRSHHPVDQAAVTTRQAPITVPALLASIPEGRGPPAKVRVLSPSMLRPHLLWELERDMIGRQRGRAMGLSAEGWGDRELGGSDSRVFSPFSKYEGALHFSSSLDDTLVLVGPLRRGQL